MQECFLLVVVVVVLAGLAQIVAEGAEQAVLLTQE